MIEAQRPGSTGTAATSLARAVPDAPPGPAVWMGAGPPAGATAEQRKVAVRSIIALLCLTGCTTIVTAAVRDDRGEPVSRGLLLMGMLDLLTATVAYGYRDARWGRPALLSMVVPALGLYAYADYATGDAYFAGGYIFVIAVWVGLAQRPGVNLALAPLYALALWLPLSLRPLSRQPHARSLGYEVLGVVGLAVSSGETVAWLTARLASASARVRRQDQVRFAALDEESSDVRVVVDGAGTVVYVSASVEPIFGYGVGQVGGFQVDDLMVMILYPDDLAGAQAAVAAAVASSEARQTFVARIRHADQTWRHVEVKVRHLPGDDGSVTLDLWDVTDRVEGRIRLEASEENFRLLFQRSPLPSIVCDPVGLRCLRVNDAACAHYGYTHEEFLGMTLVDLLPDSGHGIVPGGAAPPGGYLRPGRWQHCKRDGQVIDVETSVTRLPFAGVDATMVLVVDVTEQRTLENQLRHVALHDAVTGLANRALFEDRLDRALATSTAGSPSVAVLFCDVDGFQSVNDSLGSEVGDKVLRRVAASLVGIVRAGDTVARFGSNEFALVAELRDDPGAAVALADRVIAGLSQTIRVDRHPVHLTVSIGIAFGAAPATADELCRNAIAANRRVKAEGRSGYRIFEPSMRSQALRRLQLTGDLEAGLRLGQFRLVYQPHVALASGQVQGFEALARWAHPTLGLIPPLDFVPLAEESGLIVPLGRWILEEACRQAASWPDVGYRPLSVAVNLSVRQLRMPSIIDDVRAALALSGLDPGRLVLEITESIIMDDTEATISRFEALKGLGVRVSIDDFGTGYSSLSYLRRFNFDVLKIDKSFVDGMAVRPEQSSAFIRTIVTLGHTLGMEVITEGIETAEQYRELVRLGSDSGQGFLMSRPLDPDAVVGFIQRATPDYAMA